MERPHYITKLELDEPAGGIIWKGPKSHYGPEEGTVLHDRCYRLTKLPAVFLTSVLADWAAWRVASFHDPGVLLKHADAVRAWQVDERYYRREEKDLVYEPLGASIESAILDYLTEATEPAERMFADRLPLFLVVQAFQVRQTIPKRAAKAFDSWFGEIVDRLAGLVPRPAERVPPVKTFANKADFYAAHTLALGVALPPEAADPDFDFSLEQREPLLDRFLRSLDWRNNEFLRSPEELKALGFEGTPYQLS